MGLLALLHQVWQKMHSTIQTSVFAYLPISVGLFVCVDISREFSFPLPSQPKKGERGMHWS